MGFREEIDMEQVRIRKDINHLKEILHSLPEGRLSCRRNESYYKWYWETEERDRTQTLSSSGYGRTRHQFKYIEKKNRDFAGQLALRTYYEEQLKDLLHKEDAIEKMTQTIDHDCHCAEQVLSRQGMHELLDPLLHQEDPYITEWLQTKNHTNTNHPESLKIPTVGGFMVRSKSEALIANMLIERGITFQYERILIMGQFNIYPDFTILRPNHEIVIWEHFGMMDVNSYQSTYASKIQKYITNGFIPYENLITTYETELSPFNAEKANRIIKYMFDD